jgi:hypothetical protein
MADRGEPYHNPDLASEVSGWSMVGENVGVGDAVEPIHSAFMASSQHRSAILSTDFTQIGVGVVQGADGRLWVVQVFRRPAASAAPAPAPAAPAAPAPPPAPVPGPAPAPAPPSSVPAPSTTAAPPTPPPTAPPMAAAAASSPERGPEARLIAASPLAAVLVPVPVDAAREAPGVAYVAALLLAAAVGMQGLTIRRLGLA